MVTMTCWLSASIGEASERVLLQKDLSTFERHQMVCIDQLKFMSGGIARIDYFNGKTESGRVDVAEPVEFISYTAAYPQINRTIRLIEWRPARRYLLQHLVIISTSFLSICNYISHHDADPDSSRPGFVGENDSFDPAFWSRSNLFADCASEIAERIAYHHACMHQDTLGRRVANISIFEVYPYKDRISSNSQADGFSFIKLDPRAGASNKSVVSNHGLSFRRFSLPMGFSYGFSCSLESLKQDIEAGGSYANSKQGDDRGGNANEGLPRPILPLLGAVMMFGGVILCWWSIAQRRAWALTFGWVTGCLGTMLLAIGVGNYVTPLW
jgi:hypothetical protein